MDKIKGIIFDLDGVLCHTDHYHYLAWKYMCDEYKLSFDEILNHKLRGVSRTESLEIILNANNKVFSYENKRNMTDQKNKKYCELLHTLTENDAANDVVETLISLRKKGYVLAIGSSSKNAKLILDKLNMMGYFDAISDGTNITLSKPNPEVFEKAADMLGLENDECLVVEDAKAGIDAAIKGGFACAGIGEVTLYDKVEYKINKLTDLLTIL